MNFDKLDLANQSEAERNNAPTEDRRQYEGIRGLLELLVSL